MPTRHAAATAIGSAPNVMPPTALTATNPWRADRECARVNQLAGDKRPSQEKVVCLQSM